MIGLAFGQGIRRALGRSSGVRLGRGVCPGHPFRPALALGFRTTFGRAGRPIGADGARVPCRRRALRLIRPLGHGSLLDPFACRFRTGSAVARLRDEWQADYARRRRRDLSARRYVYLWADGVYLQARMEPQAECMLVLIGATPEGKKELLGFQVGVRESGQAPDRATAETAIATFAEKYGAKYGKAVACLAKDRDALLAFYDFPAEHWGHLRTVANPIESVFATVR